MPKSPKPALLIMTSSRPVASAAPWIQPCSAALSVMSNEAISAVPPAASMVAFDSSMGSVLRPIKKTWAPIEPRCSAMARPMPLEDPVTQTVRPATGRVVVMADS